MSTAVYMIIKALCKLGNNAFLLCIALIWCLSKLPIPCNSCNFRFSCTPWCFTAHSWLPQGTILVNTCNSGNKCNCQNNKCIFAVAKFLTTVEAWMFVLGNGKWGLSLFIRLQVMRGATMAINIMMCHSVCCEQRGRDREKTKFYEGKHDTVSQV